MHILVERRSEFQTTSKGPGFRLGGRVVRLDEPLEFRKNSIGNRYSLK